MVKVHDLKPGNLASVPTFPVLYDFRPVSSPSCVSRSSYKPKARMQALCCTLPVQERTHHNQPEVKPPTRLFAKGFCTKFPEVSRWNLIFQSLGLFFLVKFWMQNHEKTTTTTKTPHTKTQTNRNKTHTGLEELLGIHGNSSLAP